MNAPQDELVSNPAPVTLDYGRQPKGQLTPEQQRRATSWWFGILLVCTVAYWSVMFWTCQPAVDQFCLGPFIPLALTALWAMLSWQMRKVRRREEPARPRLWLALNLVALLLAPYSLLRADNDMFALGVRYRLWRAGGAAAVQNAFATWMASRPKEPDGRFMLFVNVAPRAGGGRGGNYVPVPPAQYPPPVRYIHEHIRSRFGMGEAGVARLDNVAFPNTADVYIGPPGWEPPGETRWMEHVMGTRRKVADGIWIDVGIYSK